MRSILSASFQTVAVVFYSSVMRNQETGVGCELRFIQVGPIPSRGRPMYTVFQPHFVGKLFEW